MSRAAQKLIAASGSKDAYEIEQSLMFDRDASAKLEWNPGSGATSYRKWTFSAWVKRASLGSVQAIFGCYSGSGTNDQDYNILYFGTDDNLHFGAYTYDFLKTTRRFRDLTGWYHIMLVLDTTQATNYTARKKIYVNGVQETDFATNNLISQNYNLGVLRGNPHYLGWTNSTYYYDGYLAEVYLIDNLPLTPSSFGETDSVTGQWIPIEYTGTFPGESTYVKFVSGAIGTDSSGQGNNWTASNLANSDVLLDTPTNNYCILNGNQTYNSDTGSLKKGGLFFVADTYNSGHYSNISSTFNVPSSGKWYIECRISIEAGAGNVTVFGVTDQKVDWDAKGNENLTGMAGFFNSLYGDYIRIFVSDFVGSGDTSATATSYILGMALDVDNSKVYLGVDSGSAMVWWNASDGSTSGGDPTSGSTGTGAASRTFTIDDTITVSTAISSSGGDGSQNHLNFGQNGTFCGTETAGGNADGNGEGNFFRAPPSGYLALCAKNLPTPTIKTPGSHFNTVTYTGSDDDAVSQSVTGVGFQPDWIWIKRRNLETHHVSTDAVRGAHKTLNPNRDVASVTDTYGVTAFGSDGFTVREQASAGGQVNTGTLVSWNWKLNGSGSTDTSGDIDAVVSANTTAGISILTFTANGTDAGTIPHGLGVVPKVAIKKRLDSTGDWHLRTTVIDGSDDYLALNTSAAASTFSASYGSMTSQFVTNSASPNGSSQMFYVFAEVPGFSKFGSFYGTSHVNGTAVVTGFRPAFVMIKRTDAAGYWWGMMDNKRNPYNDHATKILWANDAAAESTDNIIDFLADGFKLKGNTAWANNASGTYFYMAFADSPLKYANAR